ncbi:MAG: aminotransferase class V-fold PLP-dependent enzyme [Vicinamibacteria bacterium]
MSPIYLDHAATTPVDPEVLDAMLPYLREDFGNPSSLHRFGQRARGAIDEARARVAALLGARDAEIVFTGSGTEADNLAIAGALGAAATRANGPRRNSLVTSAIEHHAILNSAKSLDRARHTVTVVRADEGGQVDLDELENAIDDATALVSVMSANNETGVIQPVVDVVRLARARGALVHTDAVQAVGKIPIDVRELAVDLLTASAHKIHGPKGVGALYIRSGSRLTALIRGGSQERNRRAGTENVAGIVGFGKAAELARSRLVEDATRGAQLRNRLEQALVENGGGAVRVNGAPGSRIFTTTSLSFEGVSGEDLLIALDLSGIAVSTGAACAAGSPEPSHVLKAMGLPRERVNGSLRFSLGRGTTAEEIDRTIEVVTATAEQLRKKGR